MDMIYKLYIGTYTKSDSEGIYTLTLDTSSGRLSAPELAARIDNPTYLAVREDNKVLYTVAKAGAYGGVAAFNILEGGKLELINEAVTEGAPPCHVSVESDHTLLTANYHKGTVEYFPLNTDGSVNPAASSAVHKGSGPDPRQEKAHSHFAAYTPDKKFIAVAELGTDQILTYRLNDGSLEKVFAYEAPSGSGPRHLAFHPSLPVVYAMTEFSSEVLVLSYDAAKGSMETIQMISALPGNFDGPNQGSAIHLSSDGRFLYAANRGHDSIAVFQIDSRTGTLIFIEHTGTYGEWPRDFSLDPSERFLIASNQNTGNLTLFSRNKETGRLTLIESEISVPEPVCVKFLHY